MAVIVLGIGVYLQWWKLTSVEEYIPEAIILAIPPLLAWTFRRRITRVWRGKKQSREQSVTVAKAVINDTQQQQQKNKEREQKQRDLRSHCLNLSREFLTHYSEVYDQPQAMPQIVSPAPEGFFTRMLRTFRFREQFMAHLYTEYRDVYSSLKDAEEAEKSTVKLANELREKIQQKMRAQFRNEISFQSIVKQGHPTLDDRGIIWHIMEEIDLDK